jgi:hypothetical protein
MKEDRILKVYSRRRKRGVKERKNLYNTEELVTLVILCRWVIRRV